MLHPSTGVTVTGSLCLSGYTAADFNSMSLSAFVKAVAKALNIPVASVNVKELKQCYQTLGGRRRLTQQNGPEGCGVTFNATGVPQESANSFAKTLANNPSAFVVILVSSGLTQLREIYWSSVDVPSNADPLQTSATVSYNKANAVVFGIAAFALF